MGLGVRELQVRSSLSRLRTLFVCTSAVVMAMIPSTARANYYSVGDTTTAGAGGGYAQALIEDMSAPDCASGGHTNQTLWTSTDNGNGWVEIGWTRGFEGSCNLIYYIAWDNPADGYHEAPISGAATGVYTTFEGQEVYSGEYDLYMNGVKYGGIVGAQPWTTWVEVGLEQTAAPGTTVVVQTAWDWHETRAEACCSWSWWANGGTYNTSGHTYAWTATNPWIHGLVKP